LNLYLQIIEVVPRRAAGFAGSIKSMGCNEFLKWELLASHLLWQDRNGREPSKSLLAPTVRGYRKLDSQLEEELGPEEFGIKAEALSRYARLCELLSSNESALEIRKRSRTAFRHAASYFREFDNRWEEYKHCVGRSVVLGVETDPSAKVSELVKDIDEYYMDDVADELLDAGYRDAFVEAAKLTFEKSTDGETAYYAAERWLDHAVKEGNWELADLCLGKLLDGEGTEEALKKIVPLLIETDAQPDKREFRKKLFESDDLWVLVSLADAMLENKRWDDFEVLSRSFFSKCDDGEWSHYAAERWLEPAIACGRWSVVNACWERLEDSDYFYESNAEDLCKKLVPIVFQQKVSTELTSIQQKMLSAGSWTFREALADQLAEESQWEAFGITVEAFANECDDDEWRCYPVSRWLPLVIESSNAELATKLWGDLCQNECWLEQLDDFEESLHKTLKALLERDASQFKELRHEVLACDDCRVSSRVDKLSTILGSSGTWNDDG